MSSDVRWTRLAFAVLLLFVVLGMAALSAVGAPRIEVTVGIAGHVVRLHYAPIWVEVSGLDEATDGSIVVRQKIGNPAEDPADIEHVLIRDSLSDGIYEATVPVYDPLNPLEVSLAAEDGSVLARSIVNVRMNRRTSRFPAVCGFTTQVAEDAVFIDTADLPADWWGFDGLRSLWLGGDCTLSNAKWQSVAEWTLAGGSLIVLTGSDFYRMDSPALHRLLPITDPRLETSWKGEHVLVGDLKAGARVVTGSGPLPLVISGQYGAGQVLMVTKAASDVSPPELAAIVAGVPSARNLTAQRVSDAVLREMSVIRPSYLTAPAIVVASLGVFAWFAKWVERRPRRAMGGLAVSVVIFAVLSGLYTNPANRPVDLYISNTTITVQDGYGVDIGWYSLYSSRARELALNHEGESHVLQSLIRAAPEASFDSASDPSTTWLPLETHETRELEFYGREPVLVEVRVIGNAASVVNRTGQVIEHAIVLSKGLVYRLPPIVKGEQTLALENGEETYVYESGHVALDLVFKRFEDRLGLFTRTWLVLFEEAEAVLREGKLGRKVRDTSVHLIRAETT